MFGIVCSRGDPLAGMDQVKDSAFQVPIVKPVDGDSQKLANPEVSASVSSDRKALEVLELLAKLNSKCQCKQPLKKMRERNTSHDRSYKLNFHNEKSKSTFFFMRATCALRSSCISFRCIVGACLFKMCSKFRKEGCSGKLKGRPQSTRS